MYEKYREIFDETKKTIPPLLFPNMIETLNRLNEKVLFAQLLLQEDEIHYLVFLKA